MSLNETTSQIHHTYQLNTTEHQYQATWLQYISVMKYNRLLWGHPNPPQTSRGQTCLVETQFQPNCQWVEYVIVNSNRSNRLCFFPTCQVCYKYLCQYLYICHGGDHSKKSNFCFKPAANFENIAAIADNFWGGSIWFAFGKPSDYQWLQTALSHLQKGEPGARVSQQNAETLRHLKSAKPVSPSFFLANLRINTESDESDIVPCAVFAVVATRTTPWPWLSFSLPTCEKLAVCSSPRNWRRKTGEFIPFIPFIIIINHH